MILLLIVLVVLIITINDNKKEIQSLKYKIKKLTEENVKLKEIIQRMKDGNLVSSEEINQMAKTAGVQRQQVQQTVQRPAVEAKTVQTVQQRTVTSQPNQASVIQKQEIHKVAEKVVNKEQVKNRTILLTGAFLIILAGIILLLSTWSIMPNVIKTLLLFLFLFMFFTVSQKAENMGLKDTSKTFFNLAMAYLPICLLSISLFGLLGEYLSITGDGKFVYLTAVFLAMSGTYYKISQIRESEGYFWSSILSQMFTVVLFSLIFETNINLILLNLSLYNILLVLVPKRNEILDLVTNILAYLGLIIGVLFAIFGEITGLTIINLVAIFVVFAIITKANPITQNGLFFYVSIISILTSIVRYEILGFDYSTKLVLLILGTISSLIIENNLLHGEKYKNIKITNYVLSHIVLGIIFVLSSFNNEDAFLQPYLVALIISILSTITYLKYNIGIFAVLIPITFSLFSLEFLEIFKIEHSYHIYMITGIVQFILFKLFAAMKKDSKIIFEIVINVILIFMLCTAFDGYGKFLKDDFGYFLIIFALYAFSEFVSKSRAEERCYRFFAYISSFFMLATFFEFILVDTTKIISYIPLVILISSMILENMYDKFNDDLNKFIRISSALLACVLISTLDGVMNGIVLGITAMGYLLYNRYKEAPKVLDLPMMLIMVMLILVRNTEESILKAILLLVFIIYSTVMSIVERKINFYSILSYVYIFSFMGICDSRYLNIVLILINSLIQIPYMVEEKNKDLLKFVSSTAGLALYLNFVDDFIKIEMISIKLLGWLVLAVYTNNKILNKYISDSQFIRVLTYISVYIVGTFSTELTADKMFFMLMELVVIIYGYNKKLEAEFTTTIIAIAIQAFLLTAEFWFAVPWWIYLIIIGGSLIAFGMRNESKENNNVLKEMYINRFKK